jgi:NADPH:quinone reductase
LQQYALVDADFAARIPDSLTDDDAAAAFPTNAMAALVALSHASGYGVPPPYAPPAERDAFRAERHAVVVLGARANCGRMGV